MKTKITIKRKVILGFSLAVVAMILTGIISYNSYKELLSSLNETSNPEVKLTALSGLLADISEAEASMRAYSLTRNDSLLNNYREFVSSVHQKLDSLKKLEPVDLQFNSRIDSIAALLNEKIQDLNQFMDLKEAIAEINFSLRALDEINSSSDSLPALRTTKTTTTTTTTLERIPVASQETEDNESERRKKRRRKKRVQELAQQIAKLELEPNIQTQTRVTTDTSFIKADTVLGNVSRILEEVGQEERRYQRILARQELELIEGNVILTNQIRNLLNVLEREELDLRITQANRAKIIASRSTLTVSIIIILCMIAGLWLIYLITKDINFRNFYQKQLIGAKNQAEQLAHSKQQFLANMSHEIRTPLNAIIGYTNQLSCTELTPSQKQYLDAVRTSGSHLLNTVNDILDYSKIEAGELSISSEPFNLNRTVSDVVQTLSIKAQEKDLDLSLEIPQKKDFNLQGDSFRLKQVLFNLISNGIKFTDEGFVKIRCTCTEDDQVRVCIEVIDSGIGISEEMLPRIFKDFNQADLSTTRKYEGTGLGLAISKRLIELQEGTLEVESTPGKGSTFRMVLTYPRADIVVGPLSESPTSEVVPEPDLLFLKLLVVDDDKFNLGLLRAILNKWGVEADYFADSSEALKSFDQQEYQLILTDINMPTISGLDLCKYVRDHEDHQKRQVPVIALTANVMERDLNHYMDCGINDIVLKPYSETDLYEKLKEHMPATLERSEGKSIEIELDDFKKFSGDDEAALLTILQSFQKNLDLNLEALADYSEKKQYREVADMAHKLISSFGHLKASSAVELLRDMENRARNGDGVHEIAELTRKVIDLAQPVLKVLEKEIEDLKKTHSTAAG